jgi:hypothetical protein
MCKNLCTGLVSRVRTTLGCPSRVVHGGHDWYSTWSGRHVHCYGWK